LLTILIFTFHYPTQLAAQLLTYPFGRAWARFMPNVTIFGLPLNPGPYTVKEHVLSTIMATVASGSAYATDIVAVQRVFYGQVYGFMCEFLFCRVYFHFYLDPYE
jgi:hypothetical protein